MKNYVVGIREVGTDIVRHLSVVDSVEHYKRELQVALSNGKCSSAYVQFPKNYQFVKVEIDNILFCNVCRLDELLPAKEDETNE